MKVTVLGVFGRPDCGEVCSAAVRTSGWEWLRANGPGGRSSGVVSVDDAAIFLYFACEVVVRAGFVCWRRDKLVVDEKGERRMEKVDACMVVRRRGI